MSILKNDGNDQRSELSYAEPDVAQDASPAPIPSSAPPEESSSATPAPVVVPMVPVLSTPFQQPVSHLTFHTEEERRQFFKYRRRMHLQRTWQEPKSSSLAELWNEVLMTTELHSQAEDTKAYEEDLADQWKDFSPRSESFFFGEEKDQDE